MLLKAFAPSYRRMVQPSSKPRVAESAITSTPPETATPYWPQGWKKSSSFPPYRGQKTAPMTLRKTSPHANGLAVSRTLGARHDWKRQASETLRDIGQFIAQRSLQMAVAYSRRTCFALRAGFLGDSFHRGLFEVLSISGLWPCAFNSSFVKFSWCACSLAAVIPARCSARASSVKISSRTVSCYLEALLDERSGRPQPW